MLVHDDQRLVHQPRRAGRQRRQRSTPSPAHDRLGGVERPAAREDRQPPEQRPLRLGQQPVAPVDQAAQRLVPRERRPAAAGQQAEAVVEPRGDLLDGERPHARGGQLDRQRDAVQPLADLGHRRRVRIRQGEVGLHRGGPVDEEPHGLVLRQRRRAPARRRGSGTESGGTRNATSPVSPSGSRLVARILHVRAGPQQRLGQPRARGDQVLAVVEHEQQCAGIAGAPTMRGLDRAARLLPHAERRGERRRGEHGIGERRQLDQPHAVGVVWTHGAATWSASRVLPLPPGPVRVSRCVAREEPRHLADLPLAPDEAGELARQVAGHRLERAQRGERTRQIRGRDLEDLLGSRNVAQPVAAQIAQLHLGRELVAEHRVGGARHAGSVRRGRPTRGARYDSA